MHVCMNSTVQQQVAPFKYRSYIKGYLVLLQDIYKQNMRDFYSFTYYTQFYVDIIKSATTAPTNKKLNYRALRRM